ncbi:monoamine oxidase [Afipia sp. GAS231]|nr:monoamine oxidase [Afipia sp. GAS231]
MTSLPAPLPKRHPRRVLVLGAGMSGLTAALELEQAGHTVIVVEAQARPGGRVLTMRDQSGSPIAEAGAGRIPETHTWAMSYINRMGLETAPLYPDRRSAVIYAQGKRVVLDPGADPARHFDLTDAEKALGLDGLARTHIFPGVELVKASGTMNGPNWPATDLMKFDDLTARDYLASRGLSKAAVNLLTLGAFPQTISALTLFRVLATYDRTRLRKIRGGNDLLPRAMTARLRTAIAYGSIVRSIRQEPQQIEVSVESLTGQHQIVADAVICTIPFSVLGNVEIVPALGLAKQSILAQMRYTTATKVAFKTRKRPWEREGLSGFAQLDTMAEIWSPHGDNRVERGVLQLYQQGELATAMDAMAVAERHAFAFGTIERVFPGTTAIIDEVFEYSWQRDPWARGAYGIAASGQLYAWKEHLARPEGRIHFAGEHTSLEYAAWIEGAVRSGYRAAEEVNAGI